MNPSSLYEMRHSIVQAVSDYVDIEAEELVEVRPCTISAHPCHARSTRITAAHDLFCIMHPCRIADNCCQQIYIL